MFECFPMFSHDFPIKTSMCSIFFGGFMVVPGSRRTSKASGSPGLLMDNYAFLVMFNGNFNGIYIGFILGLYWIYMDLYEFIWIYIGLMVI